LNSEVLLDASALNPQAANQPTVDSSWDARLLIDCWSGKHSFMAAVRSVVVLRHVNGTTSGPTLSRTAARPR
jgi:hypothetical protein